jgi:hypothetical protein
VSELEVGIGFSSGDFLRHDWLDSSQSEEMAKLATFTIPGLNMGGSRDLMDKPEDDTRSTSSSESAWRITPLQDRCTDATEVG